MVMFLCMQMCLLESNGDGREGSREAINCLGREGIVKLVVFDVRA